MDGEHTIPPKSWWTTMPGLLTAVAGIITATGGLLAVLVQVGYIGHSASAQANSAGGAGSAMSGTAGAIGDRGTTSNGAKLPTKPLLPLPFKEVVVTDREGGVIRLRPNISIYNFDLPGDSRIALASGQVITFDKISVMVMEHDDSGTKVHVTLLNGQVIAGKPYSAGPSVEGQNDLGSYYSSLTRLKKIEFVR